MRYLRTSIRIVIASLATALSLSVAANAAQETGLRAVRGQVGYQQSKDAPFTRVFGKYLLGDDQIAITRESSNALLQLVDSSEVALGSLTTIQVGAITQAAATAPKAVTLVAGAIRFAVKHPAGQPSNYIFQTVTSQLAVRGTIGLYSTGPNGDVVSCLDCAPGDVTVTAGGNSFPLLTGQSAFISIAGVVTIGVMTAQVAASFTASGLTTTAGAPSSFIPGIATAAKTGTISSTTAAVAGAIGAAAAGTVISSNSSKPSNATALPPAIPTQGGTASVSNATRAPAAPSASPPASRSIELTPMRRP
jgi:hypothetical protein